MDVIFDWNLGNMIYNGLITLRRCGFPFAEIGVVSLTVTNTYFDHQHFTQKQDKVRKIIITCVEFAL